MCEVVCESEKKGQDYQGKALEIWSAFGLKGRIKANKVDHLKVHARAFQWYKFYVCSPAL